MKYLILTLFFSLTACGNSSGEPVTLPEIANAEPVEVPLQDGLKRAYFASGCFWCVEAVFESVAGVKEAVSGYSGGHTKNPTYEESNTGRTGHAEAVEVIYDPEVVDFATLTDVFFGSMDPTQKNGQGPDLGSQYRSIIFYQNADQKKIIEQKMKELAGQYKKAIAVEVLPFQKFWVAEDYHQDYKKLNPNDPYIRNVSVPRMNRFKEKFPQLLKENQPQ
ncbi:peptide-methionine (S)-S-oxide reductase MsrA [Salinimicrobium sediminilitoris]|uniref:peptide-methionine (S)-S-oxide reductase MsrA n=1 Tax=Salinimicrobium sediminilitoris TaxID=2876715 RepID=UPI001E64B25F|nr:peptide-methionine (S)-S-oxide reductase MsrA [Salinimicrobium sediminilitoris]MCC8360749.1 peptide-methionine (S)-S-oxide reductase MsrA [Salinimicrobium sediminilitoris]